MSASEPGVFSAGPFRRPICSNMSVLYGSCWISFGNRGLAWSVRMCVSAHTAIVTTVPEKKLSRAARDSHCSDPGPRGGTLVLAGWIPGWDRGDRGYCEGECAFKVGPKGRPGVTGL